MEQRVYIIYWLLVWRYSKWKVIIKNDTIELVTGSVSTNKAGGYILFYYCTIESDCICIYFFLFA